MIEVKIEGRYKLGKSLFRNQGSCLILVLCVYTQYTVYKLPFLWQNNAFNPRQHTPFVSIFTLYRLRAQVVNIDESDSKYVRTLSVMYKNLFNVHVFISNYQQKSITSILMETYTHTTHMKTITRLVFELCLHTNEL